MKKLFIVFICLTAILLAFTSCDKNDGNDEVVDYGEATVILEGTNIDIIVADSKTMSTVDKLKAELESLTGGDVTVYGSFAAERDNEIVVGYVEDREISRKAYMLLDRMEYESYFMGRYLIYAESGDIAIAYDENKVSSLSALNFALDYLIENHISDKEYAAFAKGVVDTDMIDLIAEQEKLDDDMVEEKWKELRAFVGDDITDALRTFYTLYNDSMVDWLANLYAPGKMDIEGGNWAGGFYGAPSGRDAMGFGPDITGTRQVLGLIESTGMLDNLGGDYGPLLPEKMREDIIYMVKSLQDPDGYFYHPQYDKVTMDARGDRQRRGRDLASAETLLEKLGARPTYTTPTGEAGDGFDADGNPVSAGKTTASLCTGTGLAVSEVILASSVQAAATDEYISSHAKFAEYLAGLKINENSYGVGNTLSAVCSQVRAASSKLGASTDAAAPYYGKTLVDMLIDFLDSHIDETTGMWEPTTKFRATNGFMKCISVYNECKRAFPEPDKALTGLFEGLLGDQKTTGNICDVYNIWVGISGLRSNVKNFSSLSDAEKAALVKRIDNTFAEKGDEAILNSYEKYVPYRYEDGSFSDDVGIAATHHNGLPVGLGLAEGDTNATAIATAVVSQMYGALGIPTGPEPEKENYKVPLYTESDWMRFCDIIMNLDPVIKYSYLEDDIEEDFEGYTPGAFKDSDTTEFVSNGVSNANIISSGANKYLEFNKTAKNNSGTLLIKGNRSMYPANTATITMRLKLSGVNDQRIRVNIFHYNTSSVLQSLDFRVANNKFKYISGENEIDTGVGPEEWFELKLEYFEGDEENSHFIRIYVNNTFVGVQTKVKSTAYPAKEIGAVKIVPLYDFLGTILIDDVTIVRDAITHDMTLTPSVPGAGGTTTPDNPGTGEGGSGTTFEPAPEIVDPTLPIGAVNFENLPAMDYVIEATKNSTVVAGVGSQTDSDHTFTIAESASGTKYLSLNKVGRKVSGSDQAMAWVLLQMNSTVAQGSDIWFETKMSFNQTNGSSVAIRLYDGRTAASANSGGTEVGKSHRMGIKLVNGNVTIGGTSTGAAAGEWFTFRIVISGETVTAYVVAEDGTTTTLATFTDASASNIDGVQFTCNSADYAVFNFEHVYFGGTPVYSSGTDAPVQGG